MLPKIKCCFPFLGCRLDAKNCKRINLGGSQAAAYLQRLLQLKYPGHLAAITLSRMEEILHEHSYVAEDYVEGNEEVVCLRLLDGVRFWGCSLNCSQDDSLLTFYSFLFRIPVPFGYLLS